MREISDVEDLLGEEDEDDVAGMSLSDFLGTDPKKLKEAKISSVPASTLTPQPLVPSGVLRYAIPAPQRENLPARDDRGMSLMDILRSEPPQDLEQKRRQQQMERGEAAKEPEKPEKLRSSKPAASPKPSSSPGLKGSTKSTAPTKLTVVVVGASLTGCAIVSRLNDDPERVRTRRLCNLFISLAASSTRS